MLYVRMDTNMGKYLESECSVGKNHFQGVRPVPSSSVRIEHEYSAYIELALLAQSVCSKLRWLRQNQELQVWCVSRYITEFSLRCSHKAIRR